MTQTLITSKDEHFAFESAWREFIALKKADSAAFVLQALLRGRDPRKGFTPISNTHKLANGQRPMEGYWHAVSLLSDRLGYYVQKVWPQLMEEEVGPTRYEPIVKELAERIAQLKREG